MTTGSRNDSHLVSTETYDITVPGGTRTSRGFYDVGLSWSKTWTGTDYPVKQPPEWEVFPVQVPVDKRVWDPVNHRWTYQRVLVWHRYRRLVRKPKRIRLVDHPYSMSISSWSDKLYSYRTLPPYTAVVTDHFRTFREDHGEGYSVLSSSLWNSNDDLSLIGKLRERICGSDFDMGVFLGEGHQTLTMIANSAHRIRSALVGVRHGDISAVLNALGINKPDSWKRLRKTPREIADSWLELQYGWLPLLSDAEGAAQALAKQLNFPMVQNYRVRKHKEIKITANADVAAGMEYDFAGFTRTQLIARLSEVNVPTLVGLTDPLSVVWELVPYSFVADWFIPIGTYLQARGLASAITGTFVTTKTVKKAFKTTGLYTSNQYFQWPGHSPYNGEKAWYRSFYCNVDRTVSTNLQIPLPSFKPLSKVLSWRHCANAVALLVQQFSRMGNHEPLSLRPIAPNVPPSAERR